MSTPEDRPALVDQDMTPHGIWRARLNAFMAWEPAEGSTETPVGPLLPQEHESGGYYPSAGNAMKWVPAVADAPALVLEIVDAPGDEDQADADVVDNVEQARS
jgi:hypothetical protein